MITYADYIGPHTETPTEPMVGNATILLSRVNTLLIACGFKTTCASGWRPPLYNAELRRKWQAGEPGGANTAVNSKHMTMEAIDLADNASQQIANYLNENKQVLQAHGLWMEHPASTKGARTNWCHLQKVPPKSGNFVFYP